MLNKEYILWLDDLLEPPFTENVLWCRWDGPALQMIYDGYPIVRIDATDEAVDLIEWIVKMGMARQFTYNIHSGNIDKSKERRIAELLKPYNVLLTFNLPSKIIPIDFNKNEEGEVHEMDWRH